MLPVTRFASGQQFRDVFVAYYGLTIAAYRNIADDPDRIAQLDRALIELGDDAGSAVDRAVDWEYLLVLARVR